MSTSYRGKRSAGRRGALWAVGAMAALALAAAAVFLLPRGEDAPPGSQAGDLSPVSGVTGAEASSGAGEDPDAAASSVAADGVPAVSPAPSYDFSQPVPERAEVDNHYFDDAAFVGDSRTDGFMIYSGIGTGENLTSNGLSVFSLPSKKALAIGGQKYTLLEALALQEYGKVYISLGVNELGYYDDDGYYESYSAAIDEIRRVQPNAVIYIQSLIPVNEQQCHDVLKRDYLENDHLRVYNSLMKRVAEEKQVAYLDLYAEFVDETGSLPQDLSRDGVHLYQEACQRWLAYLKTHTVDFETLYPDGPPAAGSADTADGSGQA